jgi:outer membrane protein assembly factor BamB
MTPALNRSLLLLVLAAPFALSARLAPAAENWSRFRGPNGAGAAEDVNFPATWIDDDYEWKIALPGKGHSSPIGWGDRIFITAGDPESGKLTLLALDAATGQQVWTRSFDSPAYPMHLQNSLASSTPAADDRHVYVAWASPESLQVVARSHDGTPAWRRDLGPVDFKHGFGASPIVVDDLVIMPCDHSGESFIVALDSSTGEVRWRTPRKPGTESYATPAIVKAEDGSTQIIVDSTAEGMAALSLRDGSAIWQLPDLFVARCVASPLVAGGLVIGTSGEGGNGRNFAIVKPPESGDEAKVVHELKTSIPQVITPVAHRGLLFVWSDRGVVTCCNLERGEVNWTERVGGRFAGSPIVAGDKIYCMSLEGEAVVLAASDQFKVLGRSNLGEGTQATPTVHNGRMYLRTETSLACLPPDSP